VVLGSVSTEMCCVCGVGRCLDRNLLCLCCWEVSRQRFAVFVVLGGVSIETCWVGGVGGVSTKICCVCGVTIDWIQASKASLRAELHRTWDKTICHRMATRKDLDIDDFDNKALLHERRPFEICQRH
jgi:hypothetical protein